MKSHSPKRNLLSTLALLTTAATIITMLARAQQPVLKITNLGSNQFDILIASNAVVTTNYTLFWTRALENELYPWQVIQVGNLGQTNFPLDVGDLSAGFFKVLQGSDEDGDLIPSWQDAQPLNPAVGILSITIDSPANGFNFN